VAACLCVARRNTQLTQPPFVVGRENKREKL
jgi:hypothetical protein